MNYRHEYHAGNFADCFKHSLLVSLLENFVRKPASFFVMDTHAGTGHYDLDGERARQTGEADDGIRNLLRLRPPALDRYLGLVGHPGLYPGSPSLIRALMRECDRLVCCELHPEDCGSLRRHFNRDRQVEVHERSGWEALRALLPPREKRGLIFIDPPFEARDEFPTLVEGLHTGHGRFGHGVFAAWYPIKQMAAVRAFHADVASLGVRDIVAVELRLRDSLVPDRLNGCGMVVINPPYQFEDQANSVASALLEGLGTSELGASTAVIRLTNE